MKIKLSEVKDICETNLDTLKREVRQLNGKANNAAKYIKNFIKDIGSLVSVLENGESLSNSMVAQNLKKANVIDTFKLTVDDVLGIKSLWEGRLDSVNYFIDEVNKLSLTEAVGFNMPDLEAVPHYENNVWGSFLDTLYAMYRKLGVSDEEVGGAKTYLGVAKETGDKKIDWLVENLQSIIEEVFYKAGVFSTDDFVNKLIADSSYEGLVVENKEKFLGENKHIITKMKRI